MRDPNLGTVVYAAGDPTGITTIPELIRFIRDREARVSAAFQALARGHMDKTYVAPTKPRDGDLTYADGVSWNPGGGQGVYIYEMPAATWVQLG